MEEEKKNVKVEEKKKNVKVAEKKKQKRRELPSECAASREKKVSWMGCSCCYYLYWNFRCQYEYQSRQKLSDGENHRGNWG